MIGIIVGSILRYDTESLGTDGAFAIGENYAFITVSLYIYKIAIKVTSGNFRLTNEGTDERRFRQKF